MKSKIEVCSPVCYSDQIELADKEASQTDQNLALQIKNWRQWRRKTLIKNRIAITSHHRKLWQKAMLFRLHNFLSQIEPGVIGFYWPFKGEIDCRALVTELLKTGWQAALPAVNEVASPLEFRQWTPDTSLISGVWKIPVPELRRIVTPTVLLIPLVGFDNDRYRLGYGGGYYDRTIASMQPRPITIGIGFEQARLTTIYPQNHDIAMDVIVTGASTERQ
ncbi:MAG: 5-formyltetrahydrofolate cyclo-ligase [Gammaproteobacteria bacterium]|nr:5-formyltetrahydrofolate cyclo-ligase [Gammaproteobacteria bacterium]